MLSSTIMKHWTVITLLLASLLVSAPAAAQLPMLFGAIGQPSADLGAFPKWLNVLARYRQESNRWPACNGERCPQALWQAIGRQVAAMPRDVTALNAVNSFFNAVPYVQDIDNWGVNDLWQTPQQFLSRNGDCEDYAISKYLTLREAGWPPEAMRIVVLQDRNLNALHSVLAVTINGVNYILDNQIMSLVTDTMIHHYTPIYSINETTWWRHVPQ